VAAGQDFAYQVGASGATEYLKMDGEGAVSNAGAVSGTAGSTGTSTVTVRAYSSVAFSHLDRIFTYQIVNMPAWTTADRLTTARIGETFSYDLRASDATRYEVVSGPGPAITKFFVHYHRDDLGITADGKRASLYWHKTSTEPGKTAEQVTLSQTLGSSDALWADLTRAEGPKYNRLYNATTKRVFKILPGTFSDGNPSVYQMSIETFTATDMAARPFSNSKVNQWHTWYLFDSTNTQELSVPNLLMPPSLSLSSTGTLSGPAWVRTVEGTDMDIGVRAFNGDAQGGFVDRVFKLAAN